MSTELRRVVIGSLIAAFLVSLLSVPVAAQLEEGTLISKENLDQMLDKKFEGNTIESMLTDPMIRMIREFNLKIRLAHSRSRKDQIDQRWFEATEKHSNKVSFDQQTKEISGWVAGLPFPDVSPDDADAGYKAVWNTYLGNAGTHNMSQPQMAFPMIDSDGGLERQARWSYQMYRYTGQLDGTPVEGDGSIRHKQYLFALYPQDIRGIGSLIVRYTGGDRLDDRWVYVRSVRRIRRITGGSWMDPVGDMDFLNEEAGSSDGLAYPTWYRDWTHKGKRTILTPYTPTWWTWNPRGNTPEQKYPYVDLDSKPHWNPDPEEVVWMPKEYHVIEGIPPKEHPYSRRVIYIDDQSWYIVFMENYDKKGELWRWQYYWQSVEQRPTGDEIKGIHDNGAVFLDLKSRHATIPMISPQARFNYGDITGDDIDVSQLRRAEPIYTIQD